MAAVGQCLCSSASAVLLWVMVSGGFLNGGFGGMVVFEKILNLPSSAPTSSGRPSMGGGWGGARKEMNQARMVPPFDSATPNWSSLPTLHGELLSYELPDSVEAILAGVPLKPKEPVGTAFQLAK